REVAQEDLVAVDERRETPGYSLCLERFVGLSAPRQKNLLEHWVLHRHGGHPGHGVVGEVLTTLIPARVDARPLVAWPEGQFRRFRSRLYLLPHWLSLPVEGAPIVPMPHTPGDVIDLPGGDGLVLTQGEGGEALRVRAGDSFA